MQQKAYCWKSQNPLNFSFLKGILNSNTNYIVVWGCKGSGEGCGVHKRRRWRRPAWNLGGQNVIEIYKNRNGRLGFGPLRDCLCLGPGSRRSVVILKKKKKHVFLEKCFHSKFHSGTTSWRAKKKTNPHSVKMFFEVLFEETFSVKFAKRV